MTLNTTSGLRDTFRPVARPQDYLDGDSRGMQGWTAVSWCDEVPAEDDVRRSRQRLRFEAVEINDPDVAAVLTALDTVLAAGGVVAAQFTVGGDDATAHWFLSRNRFEEYGLIPCLLSSPALTEALPELTDIRLNELDLRESSPLMLDGEVACALTWGGADGDFEGSAAQAKRLGLGFSKAVVGDRYEEFHVDRTSSAWSSWFRGLLWDQTLIITDLRYKTVLVVCATDAD